MGQVSINNIISVSTAQSNAGVSSYNTSNLLLLTDETPAASFGTAGFKSYIDPSTPATDFGTASKTAQMATAVFSQQPNILAGGGQLIVVPLLTSETIAAALQRANILVPYFGVMVAKTADAIGTTDVPASAAIIESLGGKIAFWVTPLPASIAPSALVDFSATSQNHNRGLYYGDPSTVGGIAGINALLMMAAYAGSLLSVNFDGSNTASTMNLRSLINIPADPSGNQTLLNSCSATGVDCYFSFYGDPSVRSFGANDFVDNVYDKAWFTGAIQVAAFNYLAQSNSKVPQTEEGMSGLKGAQRAVCQQAVANGFVAPGTWNNSTTFGNQALFLQNIATLGYYIYTQPIAQQSQAARMSRAAPVSQIAIKYAGAIETQSIIVYVNP